MRPFEFCVLALSELALLGAQTLRCPLILFYAASRPTRTIASKPVPSLYGTRAAAVPANGGCWSPLASATHTAALRMRKMYPKPPSRPGCAAPGSS